VCNFSDYGIFDIDVQKPLAYARGTATATVRERLNTHAEIALNAEALVRNTCNGPVKLDTKMLFESVSHYDSLDH
jgi:hypothetical protein